MFTPEQKHQLLTNLDIEGTFLSPLSSCCGPSHLASVAHRTRQLESWLSDTLAAFRNRHERQLTYIPHLVRGMTMAEFGDKYDGDTQAALRGLQKERLTVDVAPLDRNEMKRKWAPAPEEEEHDTRLGDHGKNANSGHARAAKHREWLYLSPLTVILTNFYYQKFASHLHHPRRNRHPSQEITLLPACKLQRHQALYVTLYLIYLDRASLVNTTSKSPASPPKRRARGSLPAYPQRLSSAPAHHRPPDPRRPLSPAKPATLVCPQLRHSNLRSLYPQRRPRIPHRRAGRGKMRACSASTVRHWRTRMSLGSNGL
jgi:hypothetical protein